MKHRVLGIYYSQSGQVRQALQALLDPLSDEERIAVTMVPVDPRVHFPYPWKSILRFFGVMPETVLGRPPENAPIFKPSETLTHRYDLIVLAYPVWFLMPALPIQRLMLDDERKVFAGTNVVTLCVCRGMWHHASRVVGEALKRLGSRHRSNIVVTHQGPQWATFISVPRQLILGKTNSMIRGLPDAGVSRDDLHRLTGIGRAVAQQITENDTVGGRLPGGLTPAVVRESMVLPEQLAWPIFYSAAQCITLAGRLGSVARQVAIGCFVVLLVTLILIGLPVAMLISKCLRYAAPGWMNLHVQRILEPKDTA